MTQLEYDAYQARLHAKAAAVGITVWSDGNLNAQPDPGPERDLHSKILQECRSRGWLAFHGSMAHRSRRVLGEPDVVCLADNGRVLLVECKGPSGKLSVAQQAVIAHARKLGHRVDVIRSFREFLALCENYPTQ